MTCILGKLWSWSWYTTWCPKLSKAYSYFITHSCWLDRWMDGFLVLFDGFESIRFLPQTPVVTEEQPILHGKEGRGQLRVELSPGPGSYRFLWTIYKENETWSHGLEDICLLPLKLPHCWAKPSAGMWGWDTIAAQWVGALMNPYGSSSSTVFQSWKSLSCVWLSVTPCTTVVRVRNLLLSFHTDSSQNSTRQT